MYQRGAASVAEQIGQSYEEAQKIINQFFEGFPKIKEWVNKTIKDAHKTGYVEDPWGRRRHLPDILLPKFKINKIGESTNDQTEFNPLLGSQGKFTMFDDPIIAQFRAKAEKARNSRELETVKSAARNAGVEIHDNGGFIAQAERQAVNARIQGGAATLTKIAMIKIHQDEQLKNLGFKMLLAVHDELIGECPKENSEEVAKRLEELMIDAGNPVISCPMKCDCAITNRWYEDEISAGLREERDKLLLHCTPDEVLHEFVSRYPYIEEQQLRQLIFEDKDFDF